MSSYRPQQLQDLIDAVRKGRLEDELSDEDIIRLYSRIFKKCEEAGEITSEKNCHDVAYKRGLVLANLGPHQSLLSNVENKKGRLGSQLKNKFEIDNLTDISRWVASCENGYIKILPGDKILSQLYCPVCYGRLWIDPHPDEIPREEIDERTVDRLCKSRAFWSES